jgi:hypothetical protein
MNLPKEVKQRITNFELPDHDEAHAATCEADYTALDIFIYHQEPAGIEDCELFRTQLKNVVIEAKEQEAERAQKLVRALEKLNKELDYYWNNCAIDMPVPFQLKITAAQKDCARALNEYNNAEIKQP